MISIASGIAALAGIAVLAFIPLPRQRRKRLLQQALGAFLFTAGAAGFVGVVLVEGRLAG